MADKSQTRFTRIESNKGGLALLVGQFTTNSTSDPTAYDMPGMSPAYTSTGTYTITFDTPVKSVLGVIAQVEMAASGTERVEYLGDTLTSDSNAAASFALEYQSIDGTEADTSGKIISFVVVAVLGESGVPT